jgi:transcriptional regulator with XRE-family HTH domain
MLPKSKRGTNHISALRRNRGLLQKQLTVLLGHRSHRTVSHYENATALPPFRTALLLEIALGAKLSELFPDLYLELQALVLKRAKRLPVYVQRPLVGRLLGKDLP